MKFYKEQVQMEVTYPAKIYIGNTKNNPGVYELHWHEHLEFNYIIEGQIIAKVNGLESLVDAGQVLLINTSDLHETKNVSSSQVRAITILMDYSYIKKICPEIDSLYFHLNKSKKSYYIICEYLKKIGCLLEEKPDYYELQVRIILNQILLNLLEFNSYKKQNTHIIKDRDVTLRNVKKALSYIEENYREVITLDIIANHVGMSSTYFSRFFKNHVGKNFNHYLTDVRVYHSHEELVFRDSSITEIAFNNGFSSVKAFIEAFKKVYTLTPLQYRKSKKAN